jgi:ribosomal protein S18 acetylase RimI-like enzyme
MLWKPAGCRRLCDDIYIICDNECWILKLGDWEIAISKFPNPKIPNSMNEIHIRYATPEDAQLIAELSRRTFYDTFASQNTVENMEKFMNEQFTQERLAAEVGAPSNIFIIAEINGEVAGYARLREVNDPPGDELPSIKIARIYAVQNMIGRGIGNALMKKCIDIAYETGKRVIWLGVWEKNERAIQFYSRWGFEKFGEHDFVLGDDLQKDWLMRKQIN